MAVAGSGTTSLAYDAIAAGGPGFVVVGTELDAAALDATAPIAARITTSIDASSWTSGDRGRAALTGGWMRDVAAGTPELVAVGATGTTPTIWTSQDGLAWSRLPDSAIASSASLRSVASSPSGFVVVGDDNGSAAAWVSQDGRAWTPATSSRELAGARMLRVRWLGSEFVALGDAVGVATAWSSPDGRTWNRLDTGTIFQGAELRAAVAIGGRRLLFGMDSSDHVVIARDGPAGASASP